MTPLQTYYSLTAYKIVQAMEKRNMAAYYCETKHEALSKAMELVSTDSTVSWGGSQTITEIGLLDSLRQRATNGEIRIIDRDAAATSELREQAHHEALHSDFYFMSANAISMDGKLVNVDGWGNRLAALVYGPKNVIIITGMNKVEPSEDRAVQRARKYAAPVNAIRLSKNTPCVTTGLCQNCTLDACICCQILITRMSNPKNRIQVILIGETLGF